jgi:hypothetical protein
MKYIWIALILIILLPFVAADVILPGQRPIMIKNIITNTSDFPDYRFVQIGYLGDKVGNCQIRMLAQDGIVVTGYKFCRYSIYAIRDQYFDDKITGMQDDDLAKYLASDNVKKVAENITGYAEVLSSSAIDNITKYYAVDLNNAQTGKTYNDETTTYQYNSYLYIYIIIAVLAAAAIIIYLVKRRQWQR